MIILSGICLNAVVLGMLLRPIAVKMEKPKLCETGLLRESDFLIFSVAEVLWNVGSLIIVTIAPHHSTLHGVEKEKAAFLLSIVGITGTMGRLLFVVLPLHLDKLTLMAAATYVSGLPMVLYPLYSAYWLHAIHCAVYGFCFGVQLAALTLVTVDLFGVERLTSAYGYLVMADGVGALLGPFLGGTVNELLN